MVPLLMSWPAKTRLLAGWCHTYLHTEVISSFCILKTSAMMSSLLPWFPMTPTMTLMPESLNCVGKYDDCQSLLQECLVECILFWLLNGMVAFHLKLETYGSLSLKQSRHFSWLLFLKMITRIWKVARLLPSWHCFPAMNPYVRGSTHGQWITEGSSQGAWPTPDLHQRWGLWWPESTLQALQPYPEQVTCMWRSWRWWRKRQWRGLVRSPLPSSLNTLSAGAYSLYQDGTPAGTVGVAGLAGRSPTTMGGRAAMMMETHWQEWWLAKRA